ncbi:SIR2 family protein [Pseudomonas sp. SMSB3]|uniref:SIR2 family protein n=1 Tax=Pseudomonas sp. SMSB3 TaxID=3390196 RepID=UPI003F87C7B5
MHEQTEKTNKLNPSIQYKSETTKISDDMNYQIPWKLQEAVRNNKLVLFIGAGASRSAGLPSWIEIVKKVLSRPGITKSQAYLQALEAEVVEPLFILDALKPLHQKEIYETFEEHTINPIDSDLHKSLGKLSGKFITTNYDKLIEHNTKAKYIDASSKFHLQKLDSAEEFILKIHGTSDIIDQSVIFTSDYEELYGENSGLAKFQLQKIITTHTCLFIGFSLTDPYVVELFNRLDDLYQEMSTTHFALSTKNLEHAFVETVILKSHDDLPAFISQLVSLKEIAKPNISLQSQEVATTDLIPPPAESNEIKFVIRQDAPPKVENWTGRIDELKALGMDHRACFITGIGGQGKSALAAKFLSDTDRGLYKYCDWRDFKEEELNFQSKLYGLIELVSEGTINISSLNGLDTPVLIEAFFKYLDNQVGIFVFDNIDKYIDLERFTPAGDMALFFDKVMAYPHSSRFIFTCRPFIHYAGVGSHQIRLEGLTVYDTKELILKYHPRINDAEGDRMAARLHMCTKGHPLWMALVLAQSRTNPKDIDTILEKLERQGVTESDNNVSTLISEKILENLWSGLKDREKVILRTLSISGLAESEDAIKKILDKKLNHNQLTRAIKSLKALNLVVTKKDEGYLELHPLVREFIIHNYGKEDQESYVGLYVSYLDGFIFLLRKKFGSVLEPDDIDHILKKIEILINARKTQEAIDDLRTVSGSLLISGYMEDYIRLSDMLLDSLSWSSRKLSELKGFKDFAVTFFLKSSEAGRLDLFDKQMGRYMSVFKTADIYMILAKSVLCHKFWIIGDYESAIREGKSASDLIDILEDKDIWAGKHTYNLALRDSGSPDKIYESLHFFCDGKTVDQLISETEDNNSATKYGNVARCLTYLGDKDKGIKLLCKSYRVLEKESDNYADKHNLGYAAKWIGEFLQAEGRNRESIYFFSYAYNLWRSDMPGEANKISHHVRTIAKSIDHESITSLEIWQIKKYCNDWVSKYSSTD